jgi:hypothetical protein
VLQQFNFVLKIIGTVIPLMNFFALTRRWRGRDFYWLFQQTLREVFNGFAFQRRREQQGLFAPAGFTGSIRRNSTPFR